jgi:hypothetical protein
MLVRFQGRFAVHTIIVKWTHEGEATL